MDSNNFLSGIISAFLLAIAGRLAILLTANHRSSLGFQQSLWLAAFVVRFAISVLLYGVGLAATLVGEGDDSGWYGGVVLRETWEARGLGPLDWPLALLETYNARDPGYVYLLAVYFSVTRAPSQL